MKKRICLFVLLAFGLLGCFAEIKYLSVKDVFPDDKSSSDEFELTSIFVADNINEIENEIDISSYLWSNDGIEEYTETSIIPYVCKLYKKKYLAWNIKSKINTRNRAYYVFEQRDKTHFRSYSVCY